MEILETPKERTMYPKPPEYWGHPHLPSGAQFLALFHVSWNQYIV